MNRDTPANGGLHGQLDSLRGGPAPDVDAVESDQLLVRRYHALAVGDRAVHHLTRHARAADQLGDDLYAGIGRDITPVLGDERVPDPSGQALALRRAAANCGHIQAETELGGDLIGVFRQNGQRANPHVAEAHDANIHILHKRL